ncbi:MAG: LemA family protein [Campylobacter sp.]|nr:LemA family protein [Campylobacter sp.]
MLTPFYALLFVFALIVIFVVMTYNTLIGKKNQVSNIRASVDTQLKKRYDLIPNLVASVKEYMKHEQGILTRITELRSLAINSNDSSKTFELNNELSKLLSGIKVAVENYPNLKANENVMHLQKSLNEVESQISATRRAYNASVMDYNNSVEMFPTNIIANLFKFSKESFFEALEEEKVAPNVRDLFNN